MHHDVLYQADLDTRVPSGEEPGKSALWSRLYSMEPDTNFKYQSNMNPVIRMNNEYYQMIANPFSNTLQNGINIYINKRWKNILVDIAINDNTITGLSGKDRDRLYVALNKKLTAMNFIECINNPSNKFGFTDYLKYIVIGEDGKYKEYDYSNIKSLPHILFAEKPQQIEVKVNSLDIRQKRVGTMKPTKVLDDGKINDISEINYFNKTHIATMIEANQEQVSTKTYHGGAGIATDVMFRFSGNYFPLFYDIELFKRDNAIEYNEMQLALSIDNTQELLFNFERNGVAVSRKHVIYPGASYSFQRNPQFAVQRLAPERPPIPGAASIYNRLVPVKETRESSPSSGLVDGDRYIVGVFPTGDWSGTYSIAGTSSIFSKKNSIAEWSVGYLHPYTGLIVATGSTSSVPNWSASTPIVSTWSYYPPKKNDIVNNLALSSDLAYTGLGWVSIGTPSTADEKYLKKYSILGTFTDAKFYNQIKNIIMAEELFSGIEFIFETHVRGSQYVLGDLDRDYAKYDNDRAENEEMRNYNILSIKWKSTYGNLKMEIERQKPSLIVDILDTPISGSFISVSLGATGVNPPFQWSIGYTASSKYSSFTFKESAYSSNTSFLIPDSSATDWIFGISVKDSAGLTSNAGYYTLNAGNTYSFNGTFSYVSL